jgi:hypothetical protein
MGPGKTRQGASPAPFPAPARLHRLSVAALVVSALLGAAAPALSEGTAPIPQADRLRPLDAAPFAAALAGLTAEREAALLALVSSRDLGGLNEALVAGEVT